MQKSRLKVLIVDDSVVYRTQIRAALESLDCDIVATASNGRLALERLRITPAIDLMILDLEMPEMDGVETLRELKKMNFSGKVLVFSSQSRHGAEASMEALRLGAVDFITKPSSEDLESHVSSSPVEKIKDLLRPKISALFLETEKLKEITPKPPSSTSYAQVVWDLFKPKIVVIGASTGGPTVLEHIFSQLTFDFHCPIVIVQHMPPIFTKTFAERLAKISGHPCKEAEHGDVLENNHVYVAPGDFHVTLAKENTNIQICLDKSAKIHSVRPAVDPLFHTAAALFKHQCLGVVLTGMGQDGLDGCVRLKNVGGAVIIQEKNSCVVFGMPGAVAAEGAYDLMVTPDKIIDLLKEKIRIGSSQPNLEAKGNRRV